MIIDVRDYMDIAQPQIRDGELARASVEVSKLRDQVAGLHAAEAALRLGLYFAEEELGEPARIEFEYEEEVEGHTGPSARLLRVFDAQDRVLFDSDEDDYDDESEVTDQLCTALEWSPDFFGRGDAGVYEYTLPN